MSVFGFTRDWLVSSWVKVIETRTFSSSYSFFSVVFVKIHEESVMLRVLNCVRKAKQFFDNEILDAMWWDQAGGKVWIIKSQKSWGGRTFSCEQVSHIQAFHPRDGCVSRVLSFFLFSNHSKQFLVWLDVGGTNTWLDSIIKNTFAVYF